MDSSYPYSEAIYAYYRTDKEIPAVQKTLDYLKSDRGQLAVLEAGFMPVTNIAIPSKYQVYSAVGTGKEKPGNYEPEPYCSYYDSNAIDKKYFDLLDAIKDKTLINEILALLPDTESDKYHLSYGAINGYLLASSQAEDGTEQKTLIIDMFTGESYTELSDLFYKGADFVPLLNNKFNNAQLEQYYDRSPQKCDRMGLIGTPGFNLFGVYLPYENPYYHYNDYVGAKYGNSQYIEYNNYKQEIKAADSDALYDLMPIYEYRDMTELFLPEYREKVVKCDLPYYTDASYTEGDRYYFAVDSRYEDTTVINNQLRAACDTANALGLGPYGSFEEQWSYEILDNCFQFYGGFGNSIFIDRTSGKVLKLSDIFKADYIEKMIAENPEAPKDYFTDTYYLCVVYAEREYGVYMGGGFIYTDAPGHKNNRYNYNAELTDLNEKYADIPEKAVLPP